MKITYIILLILLCSSYSIAQNYGIAEVYYDTPSKLPVYGFSHSQNIIDTTFTWASYTWYWSKQLDSKQWLQYWIHNRFALAVEIELWNDDERTIKSLRIMPRIGMQFRLW